MIYKCVCGREFDKPNSFNGHKSHCLVNAKQLGKYDYLIEVQLKRKENQAKSAKKLREKNSELKKAKKKELDSLFAEEKHTCEKCGKVMTEKFGSGRFCSRSCANSHVQTEEVNAKRADKIHLNPKWNLIKEQYLLNPNYCIVCGKELDYGIRGRKTCSSACLHTLNLISTQQAGLSSASKRVLRSKNEMYFCQLCEKHFNTVKHNEPIFNGWDADVIIEDIKYAIMWNGPWHYYQLFENQKLQQIQTRDALKLNEIKKCGYTPYVIKDDGGYNPEFVEQQFELFIESL